jgi:hypothetical protein
VDRLALAPVDGPEEAGSLPTRELSDGFIEVPESLLQEGLELDAAAYDADDPLLFAPEEVLAHEGEGETPQAGTISAPIDAPVVEAVLVPRDVPRRGVVEALETMARWRLVTVGDNEAESRRLVADDRVVVGLEEETWRAKVATELDVDDEVLEAVRDLHGRQAERLKERADESRRLFEDRVPVVVQPDRRYDTSAQPE